MSQSTFFLNMHWHKATLHFPQNDLHGLPPSSWTVTRKISDASYAYTQKEAEKMRQFPLADGTFECENTSDSSIKAILDVYMEIPCMDTELPAEGTFGTPNCVEAHLKAHKLLTLHEAKYSPGLVQYMEGTQTSEDRRFYMPGGKIYYLLTNKVPGVPLGEGLLDYTEDGRTFEEGLFWKFPRDKRDQVRAAFQVAYREHVISKATIVFKTLDSLFWDKESGNVYIQGDFEPLDRWDIAPTHSETLDDYGPKVLATWGLAIAPKGKVDYDLPMDKLEKNGWLL